MRRIAAVVTVLLVAGCNPFSPPTGPIGDLDLGGPVIGWSGGDGKGHTIQMSFEQSGNSLTGNGELTDFTVYPVKIYLFTSKGTYTGTPPAGSLEMRFTSAQSASEISFSAVRDGDTMVGQLVGGPIVGRAEFTLTKFVR